MSLPRYFCQEVENFQRKFSGATVTVSLSAFKVVQLCSPAKGLQSALDHEDLATASEAPAICRRQHPVLAGRIPVRHGHGHHRPCHRHAPFHKAIW